jgi:hypothetical protein
MYNKLSGVLLRIGCIHFVAYMQQSFISSDVEDHESG